MYPLGTPRKALNYIAPTIATAIGTKCTSAKVGDIKVIETMYEFKSRRTECMLEEKFFKVVRRDNLKRSKPF